MLWFVLFIIIGIFVVGYNYRKNRKHNNDVAYLLMVIISIIHLGAMFAFITGGFIPYQEVEVERVQLITLRDEKETKGRHFLGTGNIDTKQYYFFYKKNGEGYQPGKILVNGNVTIFEKENIKGGEIRRYMTKPTTDYPWIWVAFTIPRHGSERYEIFIPEGSLKKDFLLQ